MNAWGRAEFGDPCHGCGFRWDTPVTEANDTVAGVGRDFAEWLHGQDGTRRHPELEWNLSGYVCHVGDSIRVWSERIVTVAVGAEGHVPPYNQDLLARARHYELVSLPAALWSLQRAVGDWLAALDLADGHTFSMTHEEVGEMGLTDVILIRAHDVLHHRWDIARILAEP